MCYTMLGYQLTKVSINDTSCFLYPYTAVSAAKDAVGNIDVGQVLKAKEALDNFTTSEESKKED